MYSTIYAGGDNMEDMNIFGSVEHNDDNTDKWPDLCENPTNQDMLDYMALVTARFLNCQKAFKGGYMLNQLLKEESRMTHDIDFSIMEKSQYGDIKVVLKELGDFFIAKGLASKYVVKETIEERSSGGIDIYRDGPNGLEKILGIDIGLHSLLYGIKRCNITIGSVEAFSVERMLSDKILAILSRKRFRRTKDLYDFYVIVNRFDFSYNELVYCLDNRENYDKAVWDNIPFSEIVLEQYKIAWDKLKLVSYKDGTELIKPDFESAISLFNRIAIRLKYRQEAFMWSHESLNWRI